MLKSQSRDLKTGNNKQCRLTSEGSQALEQAIQTQAKSDRALAEESGISRDTVAKIRNRALPVTFRKIDALFSCLNLELESQHYEFYSRVSNNEALDTDPLFLLFADVPLLAMQNAYRGCSQGCDLLFPKTRAEVCHNLTQLSQTLRVQFVRLLISDQSLSSQQREQLQRWQEIQKMPETGSSMGTSSVSQSPIAVEPTEPRKLRLETRHADLQSEWLIRNEKLRTLNHQLAIEAGTAVNFQLKQEIQAEKQDLERLEDELERIEQELRNELSPQPQTTASSKALVDAQPSLMFLIQKSRSQRGRYGILACLVRDLNPTVEAWDEPGITIAVSEDEAATFTPDELPTVVAQTVERCCREQGVNFYGLLVQCFLPIEILNIPIESAPIQVGRRTKCLGKECKAVVIRSLERQVTDEYAMVHEAWKLRWRNLMELEEASCGEVMLHHCGDEEVFYEALRDRIGCRFVGVDEFHEQRFDELFIQGIPLALWVRSDHELVAPTDALSLVDDCCIEQLPAKLTELRRTQPQITKPLALLWDNPDRPFPSIPYESQSA